jgi:hypothetical protein
VDAGAPEPSSSATGPIDWAGDVAFLAGRIEAIHPDPFHGVSKATFEAAVGDLLARLPGLADDEILVGLMELVALVGREGRDGHMGLWPPDNPGAVHRFPIRTWQFPDGLYVTAAEGHDDLVGSRIVAVDGVPVDEVLELLDPVVPRDNDSNLRDARSVFLSSAEVLDGLGIAGDPLTMTLEVEAPGGTRRTASIDAVGGDAFAEWVGGWELPPPARPGLAFLEDLDREFTLEYVAPSRSLVVRYRHVMESSAELVEAIRHEMHEHAVERIVLDLRVNGGGEAGGYRELLRFLVHGAVDRLEVLIGRLTFSAGTSLVVLLQRQAPGVVLLGEPTGGAPSFWADPETVTLPSSRLNVLVASRYVGVGGPDDERLAVEPDLPVPFTADDYFAGRDPVLEAALAA